MRVGDESFVDSRVRRNAQHRKGRHDAGVIQAYLLNKSADRVSVVGDFTFMHPGRVSAAPLLRVYGDPHGHRLRYNILSHYVQRPNVSEHVQDIPVVQHFDLMTGCLDPQILTVGLVCQPADILWEAVEAEALTLCRDDRVVQLFPKPGHPGEAAKILAKQVGPGSVYESQQTETVFKRRAPFMPQCRKSFADFLFVYAWDSVTSPPSDMRLRRRIRLAPMKSCLPDSETLPSGRLFASNATV